MRRAVRCVDIYVDVKCVGVSLCFSPFFAKNTFVFVGALGKN